MLYFGGTKFQHLSGCKTTPVTSVLEKIQNENVDLVTFANE